MTYPNLARAAAALLLLAPAAASGESISTATPDHKGLYSHAIPLAVSGRNAVVQLRLPPAVYLHAASADLHDLRVFEGGGRAVPFALTAPPAYAQVQRRELPAAIFPVHAEAGGPAMHSDLEIRTSADGAVTAIISRQGGAQKNAELSSLVLDFGRPEGKPAIDALVFTLPPGVANYQAQVQLEVSDDLRTWDSAGYASLSWLSNSAQQTLTSNRMEFPPRAFRYGRLTWRSGAPLQFASVVAQAPASSASIPARDSISLKPAAGRFQHDLVYNAALAIPVERISLSFGAGNVLMPAQIGHYVQLPALKGKQNTRWEFRPQLQATFFQMLQDGQQRRSGDVLLGGAHAAQWVLRPESPPATPPSMTLSWTPATMVFMASGTPPYSLHVGRHDAPPGVRDLREVAPGFSATELAGLEQAVAGTVQVRSAPQAAPAAAEEAARSAKLRKSLLWGVLLLGVAVLAVMVSKMWGQLRD